MVVQLQRITYEYAMKKSQIYLQELKRLVRNKMFLSQKPHTKLEITELKKNNINNISKVFKIFETKKTDVLELIFLNSSELKQTDLLIKWCEIIKNKVIEVQKEYHNLAYIEKLILEEIINLLSFCKISMVVQLYAIFSPIFDCSFLENFTDIDEDIVLPLINKFNILSFCFKYNIDATIDYLDDHDLSYKIIFEDKFQTETYYNFFVRLLDETNKFIESSEYELLNDSTNAKPQKLNYYIGAFNLVYYSNDVFATLCQNGKNF